MWCFLYLCTRINSIKWYSEGCNLYDIEHVRRSLIAAIRVHITIELNVIMCQPLLNSEMHLQVSDSGNLFLRPIFTYASTIQSTTLSLLPQIASLESHQEHLMRMSRQQKVQQGEFHRAWLDVMKFGDADSIACNPNITFMVLGLMPILFMMYILLL